MPTYSEFVLFERLLPSRRGSSASSSTRATCEYRRRPLLDGGTPIDLIYKRVLITRADRARRPRPPDRARGARRRRLHGQSVPLQDAPQEGEPRRCSPTSATPPASTPTSARPSREHVPWTRVVEERNDALRWRDGRPAPLIADQPRALVLKPNDDYGGAGIVLGWEVDQAHVGRGDRPRRWPSRTSCRSGSSCRAEPFPELVDGSWCSPIGSSTPRRSCSAGAYARRLL